MNFRRSLPEIRCLSQGLPRGDTLARSSDLQNGDTPGGGAGRPLHVPDATLTTNQVPTLRITHIASQVEAALEGDGPRKIERRPFTFTLSPQEAEDIRWYLEDYRIYPVEPQPKTAQRIERRMGEVGRELFRLVLAGSDVWEAVRRNLNDTRIEIETEVADALVPWELMRDPTADLPLSLDVPAFVRCHSRPALPPTRRGRRRARSGFCWRSAAWRTTGCRFDPWRGA